MANDQLTQVAAINERLNKVGQELGISASQSIDVSGIVKFSVSFDSGAFLGNFLKKQVNQFQSVLKPVLSVLEFLNTEVPLLSDYPDVFNSFDQDSNRVISVLDVVATAYELNERRKGNQVDVDTSLVSDIFSLSRVVTNLSGGEKTPFGELTVDASGIVRSQLKGSSIDAPQELSKAFKIPLLSDPVNTIFGILSGQAVDIFSYEAPKLSLAFSPAYPFTVPALGVLGVNGRVGFGISAQLGFGFDTYGLQNNNFQDGFYIVDFPGNEFAGTGELKVGPAITLAGIASLAVTVDLFPEVGVSLNDDPRTNTPGKVHLSEIGSISNVFSSPKLTAGAGLSVAIDILGTQIAGIGFQSPSIDLEELSLSEIQDQADRILGYVEQIKDMQSGKTVARLAEKGKDFVVDKADQLGDWTREKTDQLGNFVEEQYKKGKEKFEKVASQTWRTLENGAEEFIEGGTRLIKEGEKLTEIATDGAERVWVGAKATYKKGKETADWVGGKLQSFSDVTGELFTLDEVGKFVSNAGKVFGDIGDGIGDIGDAIGDGIGDIGDAIGGISLGLTAEGSSNQAPAFPVLRAKPLFPDRPSDRSRITYRPDGSILLQTGIGADVLEGTEAGDEIRAGDGNDYVSGNGGRDFLYGEGGNDVLNGGAGDDFLDGGTGNDTLKGGIGNDVLNGGANDDILFGEAGVDILNGDAGNDTLKGGNDNDFLFGGADDDTLDGELGNDQLFGQSGNDQLLSSAGNDLLDGGVGTDTARYDKDPKGVVVNIDETQSYSNTAYPFDLEPSFNISTGTAFDGFGDTDTLRNLENITGSSYDDVLIGNALRNTLNGLGGNDLLIGNGGDDILDGGDGIDTVSYRRSFNSVNLGVSVDLSQGTAFDGIDGLDTLRNIENIIGSQFADRLIGNEQANTILGGDGNDIIEGKEGNDRLFGENGNDEIYGGSGNDYLVGGTGSGWPSDILDGGSGNDTASYITATSGVAASLIAKTGWLGDATGDQFISIENLEGSNYDDFLIGDDSNNILTGLDGDDTLQGEGGDDQLFGGIGKDILRGGRGNDQLYGGDNDDTLEGGEGDDYLDGGTGDNILNAGEGNNSIFAANGNNTVYAGSGTDFITLGDGNNSVYAGEGRSSITLGNGNNKVYGGANIDIIFVGNGNNEIYAGEGENTITSGSGNDLIYGGSLADIIYAGAGTNRIFASEGNNIVVTQDGNDTVYTGSGRDFISTGGGDDTIYASEGDNWINAGTGNNNIYSGSGRDLFILNAGVGFNTINNFEIGKDKLGLVEGLQPDQLTISQVNSGSTFFTQISIAGSGDILARLNWTQANQLTGNSFMPNLPSSTNSLLSMFG
jgi:Ca2+-binding RTX toxin-like protein